MFWFRLSASIKDSGGLLSHVQKLGSYTVQLNSYFADPLEPNSTKLKQLLNK